MKTKKTKFQKKIKYSSSDSIRNKKEYRRIEQIAEFMREKFCPVCGAEIKGSYEKGSNTRGLGSEYPKQLKVPLISMILSTFFPGLGQIYNGDSLLKGLVFFFGCIFGSFMFLIPGLIIWIYGMYDAYSVADKINKREIEYKETKNRDIVLIFLIPLALMLIFMVITLYLAIQMIGNLNGIFPDTGYLMNPETFTIDYSKNLNP